MLQKHFLYWIYIHRDLFIKSMISRLTIAIWVVYWPLEIFAMSKLVNNSTTTTKFCKQWKKKIKSTKRLQMNQAISFKSVDPMIYWFGSRLRSMWWTCNNYIHLCNISLAFHVIVSLSLSLSFSLLVNNTHTHTQSQASRQASRQTEQWWSAIDDALIEI